MKHFPVLIVVETADDDDDDVLDDVSEEKECSDEKDGSKCTTSASSDCKLISPNRAISQPRHEDPQEQREQDKP